MFFIYGEAVGVRVGLAVALALGVEEGEADALGLTVALGLVLGLADAEATSSADGLAVSLGIGLTKIILTPLLSSGSGDTRVFFLISEYPRINKTKNMPTAITMVIIFLLLRVGPSCSSIFLQPIIH